MRAFHQVSISFPSMPNPGRSNQTQRTSEAATPAAHAWRQQAASQADRRRRAWERRSVFWKGTVLSLSVCQLKNGGSGAARALARSSRETSLSAERGSKRPSDGPSSTCRGRVAEGGSGAGGG